MDKLIGCVFALAFLIALNFLWALCFQDLWNWLMPMIFHLPILTYWEAYGCVLLLTFVGGFFKSVTKSE